MVTLSTLTPVAMTEARREAIDPKNRLVGAHIGDLTIHFFPREIMGRSVPGINQDYIWLRVKAYGIKEGEYKETDETRRYPLPSGIAYDIGVYLEGDQRVLSLNCADGVNFVAATEEAVSIRGLDSLVFDFDSRTVSKVTKGQTVIWESPYK